MGAKSAQTRDADSERRRGAASAAVGRPAIRPTPRLDPPATRVPDDPTTRSPDLPNPRPPEHPIDRVPADAISAVRHFNRFYTTRIGVLQRLQSPLSLTEARLLYELAHRERPTAAVLARDLDVDPGYLSRLLRGLERRRFIRRRNSNTDRRQAIIDLTRQGRTLYSVLDRRAQDEVASLVAGLPPGGEQRLTAAMRTIERLLDGSSSRVRGFVIRPHEPGDMGWVVSINGSYYARAYGWDMTYEALVAGIVKRFIERFDPAAERCWIAEIDGVRVGSVFLVRKSRTVAQLRLLIVDPSAHGLGIGHRLVSECERFARQVGYRKIILWTNTILDAARHIYRTAGYRLVDTSAVERRFGKDMTFETWELSL
jgi:DNA-binding MarR family transcriptional regulator/N-acetylglutamate synthase-like GNAT family acetyltransferase